MPFLPFSRWLSSVHQTVNLWDFSILVTENWSFDLFPHLVAFHQHHSNFCWRFWYFDKSVECQPSLKAAFLRGLPTTVFSSCPCILTHCFLSFTESLTHNKSIFPEDMGTIFESVFYQIVYFYNVY